MPPLIPPELGGAWGLPKEELVKIPGFNPNHSVDLEIARQKLRESGIDPKGLTIQFPVSDFPVQRALGEAIVSVLTSQLGLKINFFPEPLVQVNERLLKGSWDFTNRSAGASGDPSENYSAFLAKDGSTNYGKYVNPRIDQLLQDQDSEVDPAKRRAMLWEVQRIELTEFPLVPYLYEIAVVGTRPGVFGFVPGPTLTMHSRSRLDRVWLER